MPFADLHCHPAFWSFNKIRNSDLDAPGNPENHIWNIVVDKKKQKLMKKGARAIYSQSDFSSLTRGEVRLVFAALYSMEKGFFMGNREKGYNAEVVDGVLNQLLLNWPRFLRKIVGFVLRPFNRPLSKILNNEGWARDLVQKWIMSFSTKRINHFQDPGYNYFNELILEHDFYRTFENASPVPPTVGTTKKYQLIKNNAHLGKVIAETDDIAVVFSLEGFHSLALETDPASPDYLKLADEATILQRIKKTKEEWNVFFITFSHHFSNHLAGHAHSLPKLLMEIADPKPLMNEGFLEPGEKYIRKLLSITDKNEPDPSAGRRILIDVKHFSALSRSHYYNRIVLPYNASHPENPIPVIASHCGYYGQTEKGIKIELAHLIAEMKNEEDDSFANGFYQWNINLCDEDIRVIVESGGLIGLSFDQRIMGEKNVKDTSLKYWMNTVSRCIIAMVSSSIANVTTNPERIWKTLCLGTDFDGLIDPLNAFSTAEQFNAFKAELLRFLSIIKESNGNYLFLNNNPYNPDKVVEMICFENAYNFTLTHFK